MIIKKHLDEIVIELGLYKHYKGGLYEVLGEARFSEDPHQQFVIYKSLAEATLQPEGTLLPAGSLWARPKDMFAETFINNEGVVEKRFQKIADIK